MTQTLESPLRREADLAVLVRQHLPLVACLARRFPKGLFDKDDLYQQGCLGLMKALRRYSPQHGTAFSTYAVPVILGEMRMLHKLTAPLHIPRTDQEMRWKLRKTVQRLTAQSGREPTMQELAAELRISAQELAFLAEDVSVASSDAVTDSGRGLADILSDGDDWLTRVELRDLICRLPEADRRLLTLRYLEGLTQEETARQMDLTQVQVSRREAVLRRQLRNMWYGT